MPRFSASPTRKFLIASALAIGAAGSAVIGLSLAGAPAHAQITVFDPSNYSQNLLTAARSEEHTSELQSLMRISYAVFCLKKKHSPPTALTLFPQSIESDRNCYHNTLITAAFYVKSHTL